ncbi:molybdopterin oxidoreductase family protein [Dactylosporangium aurantiacum]|uniref:Molybdopterin oxidoreductase family protein n=1 Tax=Dactylosporangium aurantiacum TaxID=35754 RepID=A0A9Q9IMZ1_9ACTN|nr:molybdopterin oxidoreductase family protein [Dactylosporangium aurantiacum]MDG6105877.1 molybdopterin oxidoreductase family protein [Dactylosporangium aurantiacum]UWZ57948.1 molybdopterin oxidoreductase family protein [Dactylosporangium aurantiacum]
MTGAPNGTRTAYRTCPLCEAVCGLELTVTGERITAARGDRQHVLSAGFVCPKGATFGQLVHDPDRLRRPLLRGADGEHHEVSWDEAFAAVEAGLTGVLTRHGRDAVAVYLGNPNVHTMAGPLYGGPLVRAVGSRNVYSASTVDQMPKHVACGYLYGNPDAIPVPDVDRTDLLLLIGANPLESNGSLCTAPDFPGRLAALQARGGRFVVVDPRRTRTAALADEHIFIRPGGDALLLFGLVHTLFDEGLADLGRLDGHVRSVERLAVLAKDFAPEVVADRCGVPAADIRRLARELAAAPAAAVYGRIGTCAVEFGTLTSWLVDAVNVLTGNLDRPGGAMFPLAPHARTATRPGGRGFTVGRWTSRVRGLPEVKGELPVATLADEIATPGDGQVRALVTVAGNPVLSTPNSAQLDRALAGLEFMVSVDPYLNETTRHADVILPPTDPARVGHYDFAFLTLVVHNMAAYSPPVLPKDPGGMDESDILARLTLIAAGRGAGGGTAADVAAGHEHLLAQLLQRAADDPDSPVAGRSVTDLRALVDGDGPAERLLDARLRLGAYGDGFGATPDGLTLRTLLDHPHGLDLGPLRPRIPEVLRTPSGQVELCPEPVAADVARLRAALERPADGLVLVGRRHLRSNNSWMHNVPGLMKGRDRCTLQVHPSDAAALRLTDGAAATVASRVGTLTVAVEVTDTVMPGVVSLPHGWGHGAPGTRAKVAAASPGVNSNLLTDDRVIDPLSGNSVLNGIPVTVAPAT